MNAWIVRSLLFALVCSGCAWPTFGFGPARTSHNPFETTLGVDDVDELHVAWTATTSAAQVASPVVSDGIVYVADTANRLYAFDAAGLANCTGAPATCQPLWTAFTDDRVLGTPTVANGMVYVGAENHALFAFDAAGTTGCSGTPTRCRPLWTAKPGGEDAGLAFVSSPAVVDGVLYVGAADHNLYAYDADGVTNCREVPVISGTRTVCEPLWTGAAGDTLQSSPAVVNGVVYVGDASGVLYAFDARGMTNCTAGSTPTCAPLWIGATGSGGIFGAPAVADGVVYVGTFLGTLAAFDARGVTNCTSGPASCQPLWTATFPGDELASVAVAGGFVHVATFRGTVAAFDARGLTNCTGTPVTCAPLWTASSGRIASFSSPSVANGVVYTASLDSRVSAFDARGLTSCSTSPRTCEPLWTFTTNAGIDGAPAIVDGTVYVGALDGTLYAFAR